MNGLSALLLTACCVVSLQLCWSAPAKLHSPLAEEVLDATNKLIYSKKDVKSKFSCTFCKIISGILVGILEENDHEEDVVKLFGKLCILLHIEDELVCTLGVEEYKKEFLTVVYSIAFGRAKQACALLLGPSCQHSYVPWNQHWNVSIPEGKPPVIPIPDPKVC